MAYQLQKNQTTILLMIVLALIILTVTAVLVANHDGGFAVARAVEHTGTNGTIDSNISPWAIDADRLVRWYWRF